MKHFLALLLAIIMGLSLVACASTPPETPGDESNGGGGNDNAGGNSDGGTNGKVLVVYFSATGSTEGIARRIAEAVGADLFRLEPVDPYTSTDLDWTASGSRVCREHDNPALRDIELVSTTVDAFDTYDTVFIGYPIWWGIAAWPVNTFVKNNDFSGKRVIPFATSASSGIGESGRLLSEMTSGGEWLTGRRFSSGASDESLRSWLRELSLL
ncbi:MAG TPA: flavodoxin [Clostridiales bacterium]|nr:flavodoxin [Clostridiales bacterium]